MSKTQAAAVRIVKARDSATAILRKLGVKSRDYALFIEKLADGTLAVQVVKAQMHLHALANPVKDEPDVKAKPKDRKAEGETVSDVARRLIREGKTNAEVWAIIQPQFSLNDKKRGYPAWYRCQLRRKGEQV